MLLLQGGAEKSRPASGLEHGPLDQKPESGRIHLSSSSTLEPDGSHHCVTSNVFMTTCISMAFIKSLQYLNFIPPYRVATPKCKAILSILFLPP
ncbi:unnamed protein product [Protopolystoma xenopodis]|uniref:Uncharacterized protein n=1 Tax=Protopolystoma xenopodis TaxID=117903 RepID=A0A3S4ZUC0_9PLAT|nr:unnamed protein product [Protopolystoma xenopodis]